MIGVVGAAVVVLEFLFGVANATLADFVSGVPIVSGWPLVLWTGLVIVLVWVFSILRLVLLRVSQTYVLHDDSLEIRTGILSTMAFEVSPSGFSDLVVFRSLVGRLTDSGDIIIQTQTERASVKRMVRVRHPMRVGDQIREVMSRPIVRIEGSEDKK